MSTAESAPQSHPIGPSEKPLDPQLSTRLEKVRSILGPWTEPVLVAYGNYARYPEQRPNLEKLLKICCEAAWQLTHAAGAALASLDGSEFICRASVGATVPAIGARLDSDSGFLCACIKSHQAFLSNRAATDPRVDPSIRQRGIKSLIEVPIVDNNRVRGVFEVSSRDENAFNVTHIVSVQFMASLLGGAFSELRKSKQDEVIRHDPCPGASAAAVTEDESAGRRKASFSAPDSAHVVNAEIANLAPRVSRTATPLPETAAGQQKQDPQVAEPTVSSPKSLPETVEPRRTSEPPSQIVSASATSSTERRCQTRILVDSLAYVSLGEENGGILLDINDAGFSMQTALPLNPGSPRQQRARFFGNGDFEIDCELVWDRARQAGFRFSNVSADLRVRLQSWIASNGITPLSISAAVPRPERAQIAVSALAKLDELRSMLLNSKLTKG